MTILGTLNADTILGDISDDRLVGLDGDDTLYGGLGRDILDGGDGNDTLSAGGGSLAKPEYMRGRDGDDTYLITEQDSWAYILDETETSGSDRVYFQDLHNGEFTDIFTDKSGYLNLEFRNIDNQTARVTIRNPENIEMFEFADGVIVQDINKLVAGGEIAQDTVNGTSEDDLLYGGSRSDVIYGLDGDDRLRGEKGDDTLFGGEGRDNLDGGSGNDLLSAGGSLDFKPEYLRGRDGDDTYLITDQDTRPYILNETTDGGQDRILFEDIAAKDIDRAYLDKSGYLNIRFENADGKMATLTVRDYHNIEEFVFQGGTVFDASNILEAKTLIPDTGPVYKLRDSEPLHEGFKYQDSDGNWWSPDYFVIVAGGQSNMLGAGDGGDTTINPNVVAYDWVAGELVQADYSSAPAGGEGVRTGTTIKNNLFFPFANRVAEELDQPVLVIAHPISGSSIDTWLASKDGANWGNLAPEVDAALNLIGQESADTFLWLQGESDASVPLETYETKFLELLDQVKATSWGPDAAFLISELSYLGDNNAQNTTFQTLELTENDPNLEFVSTVGLTAFDDAGVHFDGESLVDLGYIRFWEAYQKVLAEREELGSTQTNNSAPILNANSIPPVEITMNEGEVFRFDVSDHFTDPDGDELFYYSSVDKRGLFLNKVDGDEIILQPDFDHAGSYTVSVYANDYYLTGEKFEISLTVLEDIPAVQGFSNSSFSTELESYASFDIAQSDLKANRGIEILDQSGLDPSGILIQLDTLHIKGDAGLSGGFILDTGIGRSTFYGTADFSVTGNDLNNNIKMNDGDNVAVGLAGNDFLYGFDGDDMLYGSEGDDRLFGGLGSDDLFGGTGKDQLFGNEGADHFHIQEGDGHLLLRDFDGALEGDQIVLYGFADYGSFSEAAKFQYIESADVTNIFFGTERLTIYETDLTELSEDVFVFM